jgi:hypothetical protein
VDAEQRVGHTLGDQRQQVARDDVGRSLGEGAAPGLAPRGSRKRIIGPDGEPVTTAPVAAGLENPVIRALARAWRWKRMLEGGGYGSVGDLAAAEKVKHSYLCRILRLTLLEPKAVEEVLAGSGVAF